MTPFDPAEFFQEQLGEDCDLYELLADLGALRDTTRTQLHLLLHRFADVVQVIDEELIPLALKVGKRDIGGPTFYDLCAHLDAALRGGLQPEEVSDAPV